MENDSAKSVVKVFAVIAWFGAALNILAAIGLFLGGSGLAAIAGSQYAKLFAGASIFLAVILLIMGLIEAYAAWGLWTYQNWARIAVIIISVLNLLNFPIGTVIGLITIYLFGFNEDVKRLFGTTTRLNARSPSVVGR